MTCRGVRGRGVQSLEPQTFHRAVEPTYFLFALILAHLARCAAAILFRPAADMVRFFGPDLFPRMYAFPKAVSAAASLRANYVPARRTNSEGFQSSE